MDGPDTCGGQHRKHGLGNHRHVDQHPVALLHTQRQQSGGHPLHFGVYVAEGVGFFGAGFGGDGNQRRLVTPCGEVAVHRVVAQVGGAADKPARKRRVAVVAHLLGRRFPVDTLGLFGPEAVTVFEGAALKLCVSRHECLRSGLNRHGSITATEFIIIHDRLAEG